MSLDARRRWPRPPVDAVDRRRRRRVRRRPMAGAQRVATGGHSTCRSLSADGPDTRLHRVVGLRRSPLSHRTRAGRSARAIERLAFQQVQRHVLDGVPTSWDARGRSCRRRAGVPRDPAHRAARRLAAQLARRRARPRARDFPASRSVLVLTAMPALRLLRPARARRGRRAADPRADGRLDPRPRQRARRRREHRPAGGRRAAERLPCAWSNRRRVVVYLGIGAARRVRRADARPRAHGPAGRAVRAAGAGDHGRHDGRFSEQRQDLSQRLFAVAGHGHSISGAIRRAEPARCASIDPASCPCSAISIRT